MLAGDKVTAQDSGLTVPDVIDRIFTGGWPALLDASPQDVGRWLRDYLEQIVLVDIQQLGARRRDPENLRRLLNSLARNVATSVKVTALAKDVGGAEGPIARATVDGYLDSLSRLRLTENSPAWAPHMRSATPLQSSPTRYFVDPSLAIAALGQGPAQLLGDLNATGFFFENLVVRDVRVYAQRLGGRIHHWRDQNPTEVDIVITLPDGRWGAFEVRMSPATRTRRRQRCCPSLRRSTRARSDRPPRWASSPPPGSPTADPTASPCSPSGLSAPGCRPISRSVHPTAGRPSGVLHDDGARRRRGCSAGRWCWCV